ncbi:poly(A) polymerase [Thermomonospora cellulosilytica]|uniref:Endonuclease/exonuclease/phosphatase family metal-dependent hydrolase/2'-5' RNA ligase/uncharacterized protein (UPF0248 family) n=1 Tax=Thermomonospora cellulosilytica TaxID=1411118 RepID=A0A7W3MY49_9ACTN|nr:poly(A) polymerase [Thermomonospora cellulosilytica]MBA9004009.1 endonuclease/exonuclease/phosphatase family metal-dependent hydrolase/2'-5' RNA ligase/uncharacterized protein (UPF0248 family) [Thermomonospora cellulosilytica]
MRTSEEVYHRIRWDPRFDPARFTVGVNVRGADTKRVPLPSFVPGGDIPWHRVLFFEADGEIVWDRSTGRDVLDSSPAGRTAHRRLLREPFFAPRTPIAFDPANGWRPARIPPFPPSASGPAAIRVLTWNTLWDRYEADRIDTARRRPLLVAELERADADVIALQEVQPELLALLLAAPWVKAGYALSTGPSARDVAEYGLVLLSRLPVLEAGRVALGPHKALDAVTVAGPAGPLAVAVTHLTSDHAEEGAARRDAELARLAEALGSVEADLVVLGDFNDGSELPARTLGLRDAWTEAHGPRDTTATFDPAANPLAAITSIRGRAARLDRVLLRGAQMSVARVELRGDSPATEDGLFLSDHYGVQADLTVGTAEDGVSDARPTPRTAVAWVPPREVWPVIQRVRAEHDPAFDRWPPHVNVMFGFVPECDFEEAAPLVAEAAAGVAPFTARLEGIGSFAHREHCTVWLDPAAAGDEPWQALRGALERAFPRCRGRFRQYVPHLTLGTAPTPGALRPELPAMSVRVGELVLLSRRGSEPMRPRATVALGTGEIRWLDDDPPRAEHPHAAAAPATTDGGTGADVTRGLAPVSGADTAGELVPHVVARLREAFGDGVVHVTGSRRLGCALPGADLDLVVALSSVEGVRERVAAAIPEASGLRRVVAATGAGLRMRVGALDVDLLLVETGDIPPGEAVARRNELDEAAAIALGGVSDADAVLEAAGDRREEFRWLARRVKAWARAKGLDAAPFGGLPGIAWCVLAARTVRDAAAGDDLLREFFARWAAWDWRDPVGPEDVPPGDAPVRICTPSAPFRLCSEQVGAGGRDLLTAELYAAWEALESGNEAALTSPPPMHRRHAAWAVVTVRADRDDRFAERLGRVRGRMPSLPAALEDAGIRDAHAWPRPFETGPRLARYAVGLGRRPVDAAALSGIAASWAAGLHGVTVERRECGEVPTLR